MKIRSKYVRYNSTDKEKINPNQLDSNEALGRFLVELKKDFKKGKIGGNQKENLLQKIEELAALEKEEKANFYKKTIEGLLGVFIDNKSTSIDEQGADHSGIVEGDYKVSGIDKLDGLIDEILEDKLPQGLDFLKILKEEGEHLSQALNKETNIDFQGEVLDILNGTMLKLKHFEIPQRKYVYKVLAEVASLASGYYEFISSEDFDFVETKYHKIEEGIGQRIQRGLSFILLDKGSGEVINYGKVKVG